jgi:hypothetical protein
MKHQRRKDLSKLHLFSLKESLNWCIAHFGTLDTLEPPKVRRNNKITTEVLVHDEEEDTVDLIEQEVLGVYDCYKNTIYINVVLHETIKELAQTFIHEYIHYLQNNCKDNTFSTWDKKYKKKDLGPEWEYDILIENEAEYHAQKEFKKLLKHLGYDYTHS